MARRARQGPGQGGPPGGAPDTLPPEVAAYLREYGAAADTTPATQDDPVAAYLREYGPRPSPEDSGASPVMPGGGRESREAPGNRLAPQFEFEAAERPAPTRAPDPEPLVRPDVSRVNTRRRDPRDVPAAHRRTEQLLGLPPGAVQAAPEYKSPTKSYRDPGALRETVAQAERVAAGQVPMNPATGMPYTDDDRARAAFVAQNLRFRSEREAAKGGFGQRAADYLALGGVNRAAYRDLYAAGRTGQLVTVEDLQDLGLYTKSGDLIRTEPTLGESVREEMLPAMVGQLPYFLFGPEMGLLRAGAGRVLSRAAPGTTRRGIGEALRVAGEQSRVTAPTVMGRFGQRLVKGGVPGAATGAAADLVTEATRGATPSEAVTAAALNAGLGFAVGGAAQVVGEGVWEAGRQVMRRSPPVRRFMQSEQSGAQPAGVERLFEEADAPLQYEMEIGTGGEMRRSIRRRPGVGAVLERLMQDPEAQAARAKADQARAAEGQLPLSDQTPEAQYRTFAQLLDQLQAQRGQVTTAPGEAAPLPDGTYTTDAEGRPTARVEPSPAPRDPYAVPTRPTEQADVSLNMERVEVEQQAATQAAEAARTALPDSRVVELESRYGTLEHLGARYDEEEEVTLLPDGSHAFHCTSCARQIKQMEPNTAILGFTSEANPGWAGAALGHYGHDFAVVDGRYIVDPWIGDWDIEAPRTVFDLRNPADAAEIRRLYGDSRTWEVVEPPNADVDLGAHSPDPRVLERQAELGEIIDQYGPGWVEEVRRRTGEYRLPAAALATAGALGADEDTDEYAPLVGAAALGTGRARQNKYNLPYPKLLPAPPELERLPKWSPRYRKIWSEWFSENRRRMGQVQRKSGVFKGRKNPWGPKTGTNPNKPERRFAYRYLHDPRDDAYVKVPVEVYDAHRVMQRHVGKRDTEEYLAAKNVWDTYWRTAPLRGRYGVAPLATAGALGADEDTDEYAPLAGAAALATGGAGGRRVFYSRLRTSIEKLDFGVKNPKPAANWIGKLASMGTFAREEFDRYLRPALEAAQRAKQQLTRQEVLDLYDKNAPEIRPHYYVSNYRSDLSEEPDLGQEAPAAPGWRTADDLRQDPDLTVAMVEEQIAQREQAIHEEQQTIDDGIEQLRQHRDDAEGSLQTARDNFLEEVGEDPRNREIAQRLMDEADEHVEAGYIPRSAHSLIETLFRDGDFPGPAEAPVFPARFTALETPEGWVIHRRDDPADRVTGAYPTAIEAWAAGERRMHYDLGGREYVLRASLEVEEGEDGWWRAWDPDAAEHDSRETAIEGETREEVLQDWIEVTFQGAEPDDGVRIRDRWGLYLDYLADYRSADNEFTDADEGGSFQVERQNITEWEEDIDALKEVLPQAEQLDAERGRVFEGRDPVYARLSAADREWIEAMQARGAVGTDQPVWAEDGTEIDYSADWQTRPALVFDPDQPHYPFPRAGTLRVADPTQGSFFDDAATGSHLAALRQYAGRPVPGKLEPDEPLAVGPVAGSPKYPGTQDIGGGANYYMILNEVVDPTPHTPWRGGHWGTYFPDVGGHVRGREYLLSDTPGFEGREVRDLPGDSEDVRVEKHAVRQHRQALAQVLREQGDVFEAYEKAVRDARATNPELRGVDPDKWPSQWLDPLLNLAQKLDGLNSKAVRIAEDESKAMAALRNAYRALGVPLPPGERTFVVGELQNDLAAIGREIGFQPPRPRGALSAEELQALNDRRNELVARVSQAEAAYTQALNAVTIRQQQLTQLLAVVNEIVVGREPFARRYATGQLVAGPYLEPARRAAFVAEVDALDPASRARLSAYYQNLSGEAILADFERANEASTLAYVAFQAAHREKVQVEKDLGVRTEDRPPNVPWGDTIAGMKIGIAAALFTAAEHGMERFAWPDAAQARAVHSIGVGAAKELYDNAFGNVVRSLLKPLGGGDVRIEETWIKGYRHHSIVLTRKVRDAIRQQGFPILAALAMVASAGTSAEAQEAIEAENPHHDEQFGPLAFGAALGMALLALRSAGKRLRANKHLARILYQDAATGLLDARAFRMQRAALDQNALHGWLVLDQVGDPAVAGQRVHEALEAAGVPPRAFAVSDGRIAIAVNTNDLPAVTAQLHSRLTVPVAGVGNTFEEATQGLASSPTARGPGDSWLRTVARTPTAAAIAGLGVAVQDADNEQVAKMSPALYALAALHLVGPTRIGRAHGAIGRALVQQLRKSEAGEGLVRFVNPDALLDPAARQAVLDFEEMVARGKTRASEARGRGRKAGGAADRAASDVIEGEAWEDLSQLSPADVDAALELAAWIDVEMRTLTDEKLASGVLRPSEALPNYLPRKYAEYEVLDAIGERPGGAPRAVRISEGKRRVLDEPVRQAERDLVNAKASGNAARIEAAEAALGAARATFLDQRVALGEIREASYRAAAGLEQGYRDVAAAQLFATLRGLPGVVHPEYLADLDEFLFSRTIGDTEEMALAQGRMQTTRRRFQHAKGAYVALPDSKTLGVLRGMVVQRDVANAINGLPDTRTWDRFINFWKQSKTVFNPGTQIANVVSNISVAHMNGLSIFEQPVWLGKAARDLKRFGPAARTLAELGVLDQNVVTAGSGGGLLMDRFGSEGDLQDLLQTTRPETEAVLRERGLRERRPEAANVAVGGAVGGVVGGTIGALDDQEGLSDVAAGMTLLGAGVGGLAASRTFRRGARAAYNTGDNVFRVALYLKRQAEGATPREAAEEARRAFGNFRSRSPLIKVLRTTVAPFILYPVKMLPRFAESVVQYPWRYLTLVAAWGALDAYAREEVGAIPEEDVDVRDRRTLGYFFPGLTQVPIENDEGGRGALGLARYTPLSGVTDVAPPGTPASAFYERTPNILQPSGPATDVVSKFMLNVDPFTGRQRYKRDAPVRRNVARGLEDAAQLLLPTSLGFHRERIVEDIQNADPEALKTDLLGPLGMRPRFIRPGDQLLRAQYQREASQREAESELRRALLRSRSARRDSALFRNFEDWMMTADRNFERRAALPPLRDTIPR